MRLRILGVDPGSATTGYGVVERESGQVQHVAHGTLKPGRAGSLPVRLLALQRGLCDVVEKFAPDVAVVEQVFVSASPRSALVLGQARGVLLAELARAGVAIHEYDPRRIKQAVSGFGAASKDQVQRMVRRLLSLERTPQKDAADALAAALCHAQHEKLAAIGAGPRPRRRGRTRARTPRVRLAP